MKSLQLFFWLLSSMLCCLSSVSAAYWFQDVANTTVSGILQNGEFVDNYSVYGGWGNSNWNDTNWGSWAQAVPSVIAISFENYTKLTLVDGQSFLEVETDDGIGNYYNVSINGSCWDRDINVLELQIISDRYSGNDLNYSCLNSAGSWVEMFHNNDPSLYEAGIWWYINDTEAPVVNIVSPTNISYPFNVVNVDIDFTVFDNYNDVSTIYWNTSNDATVTIVTTNVSLQYFGSGQHELFVCANDSNDNIGCANVSFTMTSNNDVVDSVQISQTTIHDFTEDGTNFGATSIGVVAGETESTGVNALSIVRDQFLIVRSSEVNGALNVYVNNNLIANIPAVAGGDGHYVTNYFRVNDDNFTGNPQNVSVVAPPAQDTVYIDYVGFSDTTVDSDYLIAGGSWISYFYNVGSNISGGKPDMNISIYSGVDATSLIFYDGFNNTDDVNDTISNWVGLYYLPSSLNGNYTFESCVTTASKCSVTNMSMIVDSTTPVLNNVTVDFDLIVGYLYNFYLGFTEANPYISYLSVDNATNSSMSFTTPNDAFVSFSVSSSGEHDYVAYLEDNISKSDAYYGVLRSSSVSTSVSSGQYLAYDRTTNILNVSDTATNFDVMLQTNYTISSSGNAYIDSFIINHTINDTYPFDIKLTYHNGTTVDLGDNESFVNWTVNSWNDTVSGSNTLYESFTYNVSGAVTVEWENSGVADLRLVHVLTNNLSDVSISDVWIRVPLRNNLTSSQSVQLKECIAGVNWAGAACGGYYDLSSVLYSASNESYNGDSYPTVDSDGDGLKDEVLLKVPALSERMFTVDIVNTAEPSWSTSSESPSAGGGAASEDEDQATNQTTTTETVEEPGIVSNTFSLIGVVADKIFSGISSAVDKVSNILGPQGSFYLLVIIAVVALILSFTSGRLGTVQSSRGGFV